MEYITVPVIRVQQKIGSFFLGKLTPKVLHVIANRNLARQKNAESGIQRELQEQKLSEIRGYLKTKDATFPNSIIIAIQNNPLELERPYYIFDEERNTLKILYSADVANVLDGQHRLNGFDQNDDTFELPVSIFLDISLGEQAKIFAKINSTQKKVDLSLVYELFGITEGRSYEKVAFFIVQHLNSDEGSAWKGKIKTLADKTGDIAQGAMAKFYHKELFEKNTVFRKLYDEERDTDIKNILMNYFNAIAETFPEQWRNSERKYILTKTTGFNGFMLFLISIVRIASTQKNPLSKEYFMEYLHKVKKDFQEFTSENYPSGAIGQNKIRDILRKSLTAQEKELAGIK